MEPTHYLINTYCVVFFIIWNYFYLSAWRTFYALDCLENMNSPPISAYPKLSVIIAACNEEKTLPIALPTLLAQDYPDLEIIIVNDRSTDNTEDIIKQFATKDKRIKLISITDLPENWLGKVHAFHIGSQLATGEWLLFTDADVEFKSGTLTKTLSISINHHYDHFTLMPHTQTNSFLLETVMSAFRVMFLQKIKLPKLKDPKSSVAIGIGAFNLVKKEAFLKTPGFKWLRLEVGDDVGLGLMMKKSGAKSHVAFGRKAISLVWYNNILEMFNGLEKNMFAVAAHFSLTRMAVILFFIWATVFAPIVSLFIAHNNWLWMLGLTSYLIMTFFLIYLSSKLQTRLLPSLLIPLGQLLISLMMLRSGIACTLRGGIYWRNTFYPLRELKQLRRLDY